MGWYGLDLLPCLTKVPSEWQPREDGMGSHLPATALSTTYSAHLGSRVFEPIRSALFFLLFFFKVFFFFFFFQERAPVSVRYNTKVLVLALLALALARCICTCTHLISTATEGSGAVKSHWLFSFFLSSLSLYFVLLPCLLFFCILKLK